MPGGKIPNPEALLSRSLRPNKDLWVRSDVTVPTELKPISKCLLCRLIQKNPKEG